MAYPYPEGSEVIGPAVHPDAGDCGTAIRLASGIEVLAMCGIYKRLPRDWRDRQPKAGQGMARLMTLCQGTAGL